MAPRSFISSFSTSTPRVNFYPQKYTSLTLQQNRLGSILRPQQWKLGALPIWPLTTKGMPHFLKVMCPEHLDHALIHLLQQRHGVRRKKGELVSCHDASPATRGGGRECCRGPSGYRRGDPETCNTPSTRTPKQSCCTPVENVSRHPTSRIGIPVDRQGGLFIALQCTRILGVVHHDGIEFVVSRQVSPQQKGETVLERIEARGRLLLLRIVCVLSHLLPLQARFIHIKNLLGLYPSSLMIAPRRSG